MGVDKQDLDAVLHTCLPHSLEEYVQQVRRAARCCCMHAWQAATSNSRCWFAGLRYHIAASPVLVKGCADLRQTAL
jgi:hypothetical protein